MAGFEVWGHWWLPERADLRLPGRLVVDPVHGAHLTLVGALREVTDVVQWVHDENGSSAAIGEDDLAAAGTYARILGEAEGKLFTLDAGVQVSVRGPMFGASFWQRVHVRYVYQGTQFLADEPATATTVILQPAGLNTWVSHSAITGSINPESKALNLQGAPLPVQSAALDGGATLELRHHLGTPQYTDDGVHIPESFTIAVTHPDLVPVRELIATASDIQDLISIATGLRPRSTACRCAPRRVAACAGRPGHPRGGRREPVSASDRAVRPVDGDYSAAGAAAGRWRFVLHIGAAGRSRRRRPLAEHRAAAPVHARTGYVNPPRQPRTAT